VLFWPLLNLTAVISIKSEVSRGTIIAGIRFALLLVTYKIGFPGWPEPNLDSVTGFGASIAKRGLAPAPFFISGLGQRAVRFAQPMKRPFGSPRRIRSCPNFPASRPGPHWAHTSSALSETNPQPRHRVLPIMGMVFPASKKMSGRWGDRPLGRGDGGYSNPKSVRFFWPFCCAREQQDDTQEQTGHYRCFTPENPNDSRLLA
jgi:hypothetical protein